MSDLGPDRLLERSKFFREHVQTILNLATGALVISVTFLDTRDSLGCYLEVVEFSDFVRNALGALREAHESWDGNDPLRPFSE